MTSKTVDEKLSELKLPKNIENEALRIYNQLPTALIKEMKLESRVFLIVSEAYKSLKLLGNNEQLRKRLKLSPARVKTLTKESARSGYQLILHRYYPEDFVSLFCHTLGISSDHYESIKELISLLMENDDVLQETKPQVIAAGVIFYYAKNNGYKFQPKVFAKSCTESGYLVAYSGMETIRKKISLLHNQNQENSKNDTNNINSYI
jgi:transcription initiation factor TFIIIB Brf1 subunit/transcription initiation factor TFIIB